MQTAATRVVVTLNFTGLLVFGCSSPTTRPNPTATDSVPATAVTTMPPPISSPPRSSEDTGFDACQLVDVAASSQLVAFGLALAKNKDGIALRTAVAATYVDFAQNLRDFGRAASANLRSALTEWAAASDEIAQFVVSNKPKPGAVVELGPAHPRWSAAKKAAENVCGHPLPQTR